MKAPLVTGIGCVSSLGLSAAETWENLLAGRSGIRQITAFSPAGLRNDLAGAIMLPQEIVDFAEREDIRSRLILLAVLAIDEALMDAGLSRGMPEGKKCALLVGTSLGMSLTASGGEEDQPTVLEGDENNASFTELARSLGNRYHLEGRTQVVSTACSSGTHAIALAREMILHGGYDVVIAGGADTLDRMKYLGHTALSTLTLTLPRPFAADRAGTLFGEGAAFIVLRSAYDADSCYATCAGAGYSTDIYHVTAPDPEGEGGALAIRAALTDAGIAAESVDHVNLHGSGTTLNDSAEFKALHAVFGNRIGEICCTSIKAAIGHVMGAAGAIEAVAAILSIRHQAVPPTINVSTADLAHPLGLVTESALHCDIRYALSNSFGFGGANGTLIFGPAPSRQGG
jgi:3-oxoacyl-[acyl-carrier-protein] synthase II